jgi:hypothetical protein
LFLSLLFSRLPLIWNNHCCSERDFGADLILDNDRRCYRFYAFVFADLIRDRAVSMPKFLLAQVPMPFGAVGAVLLIYTITDSQLRNIGGSIDLIVLLGATLIDAIGTAIFVYTAQSIFGRCART